MGELSAPGLRWRAPAQDARGVVVVALGVLHERPAVDIAHVAAPLLAAQEIEAAHLGGRVGGRVDGGDWCSAILHASPRAGQFSLP